MKNIFILSGLILAIVFSACNNKDSEGYDKSLTTSDTSLLVTPTLKDSLSSDTSKTSSGIVAQPINIVPSTNVTVPTATPVKAPAAKSGAGLNPAHGEPGHRCEIAVGAPLSSAPATPSVQTSAPAPVITQPKAVTPITSGTNTGKINPPHGEPGHDCAVQVGAPLKN